MSRNGAASAGRTKYQVANGAASMAASAAQARMYRVFGLDEGGMPLRTAA